MGRIRAALRITCWWWLWIGTCWAQSADAQRDNSIPVLDLRHHDWVTSPTVELEGKWAFELSPADRVPSPTTIQVPGSWAEQGLSPTNHASGTYRLRILLAHHRQPQLAINLEEVLTAYELVVNDQIVGTAGQLGHDLASSKAEFRPAILSMPPADTLTLQLRCANFRHRQAGMATAPVLGELDHLIRDKRTDIVMGGILIGLMLMSCAYLLLHYFQRRQHKTYLYAGLATLILAFHYLLLHERLLYRLAGPDLWNWCYKTELASLFWFQAAGFTFFYHYLSGVIPNRFRTAVVGFLLSASLLILLLPIQWAALTDIILPYEITTFLAGMIVLMARALIRKVPDAVPLAISTALVVAGASADKLLFGVHVGGLLTIQYLLAAYMFCFAWILSRRAAAEERKVYQLSENLEASNKALAASNSALEQTNLSLEEQVRQRTDELVQVQQSAHELEMDQVRRDIETLSANNQMKMQLTRNLVEELQQLLSAGGDYQSALKSLITGLRGQMATEERLEVLQDDLESVNAEFYRRLQAKYPQLSKTEREICAYLKLNLSGKDIAQLRKTSINTVNVARHRIRKKLGLDRDEELEAVIQQL